MFITFDYMSTHSAQVPHASLITKISVHSSCLSSQPSPFYRPACNMMRDSHYCSHVPCTVIYRVQRKLRSILSRLLQAIKNNATEKFMSKLHTQLIGSLLKHGKCGTKCKNAKSLAPNPFQFIIKSQNICAEAYEVTHN